MVRSLTKDEVRAIAALKRLAKTWPDTLWLFAGGGHGLEVMLKNEHGERAITPGGDAMDPDYIVAKASIESDGGDW